VYLSVRGRNEANVQEVLIYNEASRSRCVSSQQASEMFGCMCPRLPWLFCVGVFSSQAPLFLSSVHSLNCLCLVLSLCVMTLPIHCLLNVFNLMQECWVN
jgi:hypothetical protein